LHFFSDENKRPRTFERLNPLSLNENHLLADSSANIDAVMISRDNDERFMRAAFQDARKSLGLTSPNPAVGSVLVVGNRIVARGHHREAGLPHAEIECLRKFGRAIPPGATLYVTLEPCSTVGRTGRCTDEIIKSGIKRVVIGTIDVNPRHSGRGIELLRKAGIEVRVGVLADECSVLNEAFNKWIVTGKPFVIAKCGMTLDGRLTCREPEKRWITSSAARRHGRQLRAQVDAILIGAKTLRTDNPKLTVRNGRQGKQPLRVVLTRSGKLPRGANLFTDRFADKTLIYRNRQLDFVLRDLGKKGITSVLIEGGGNVLGQALDQKKIDKIQIYIGPKLSGGPVIAFGGRGAKATRAAAHLQHVRYQRIGQDICVTGYPQHGLPAETE
jgi:diaminohydroxyphosphoribosylaminopyrimidine deaminase/5-amino-6-(5-phosphoribosylamino)uracil reductase